MTPGERFRRASRWTGALAILTVVLIPPVFAQKNQKPAPPPSPGPAAAAPAEAAPQREDNPKERERWFYEQRAYPHKQIPPGAREQAMQRVEEMRAAERARAAALDPQAVQAASMNWVPLGPQPTTSFPVTSNVGNVAGRVSALAVHPTNQDIVYAGGAQGGVWKTTNGGMTWTPLTDFEASLAIGSIALDPMNPDIVYVGTGEQTFSSASYYGAGLLKSTDGGMTWTRLGHTANSITGSTGAGCTNTPTSFVGPFSGGFSPGGGARIGSLAIHPSNTQIILAGVFIFATADNGASSGIYRSMNGGMTWTQVLCGAAGTEVLFDPTNGNIAYAALGATGGDTDNGVYKSIDAGATWSKLSGGFPATNVGRIELTIAPSSPNTLYASVADSSTGSNNLLTQRAFRSTDAGATWTALSNTPDFCTAQCWYDHVIKVHPNLSGVVYAGGAAQPNFFTFTSNSGTNWTAVTQGATTGQRLHVDQHAIAFGFTGTTATRIYVGNDGGVWRSDLPPQTMTQTPDWVNLNATLNITQFYPGHSIHPSTERRGVGGTQDNGTQRLDGDGVEPLRWEEITCGDGGWTAIDHQVPSTWYVTCQFIAIRRSFQNGTPVSGNQSSFATVLNGINTGDRVAFIPPFIIDPSLSQRLYFGTFRLYQTNNGADLWTAISPDLTGGTGTIRTIAVAPTNSDIVYTGSSGGRIFRTMNAGAGAGAMWTEVTNSSLPIRTVTQVTIDPLNPNIVYATFSGFGTCTGVVVCDQRGHVFKSIDAGLNWTDISIPPFSTTTLPDTPVNDLLVDPADPTGLTLYAATDVGVFFTTDGGVNWTTLMSGLPRVAVLSLKLRQVSRTLRAATHGRGVWDLQLGGLPPYALTAISPTTAAAGGMGFSLTLRGPGLGGTSTARWNGMPLMTVFDPMTGNLTATVTSAELTNSAAVQVDVDTPLLGQTNSLTFTVTGPAAILNSISPTNAMAGDPAFTLTAFGANFRANSVVEWSGSPRPTFFNSMMPGQLTAQISPADVSQGGIFAVTVFNQPPGGGRSSAQIFTVSSPPPSNDNFANAIVISNTPFTDMKNNFGATTELGEPSPGTIGSCPGATSAKSIWYRFTPPAQGTVTMDTIGSVYDTVLSVWTGSSLSTLTAVNCDDDAIAVGGASRLTLTLNAGVTYHIMISGFSASQGGATVFNLTAIFPPANDNSSSPVLIGTSPFTHMVDSGAATTESNDPTPTCTATTPGVVNFGRARSIWYRFTPTTAGSVTVDTLGSNYDTILSAYTGGPGTFAPVSQACNDDFSGLSSQISFAVTANTTYHVMVSAFDGSGGSTMLNFTSTAPLVMVDFNVSAAPVTVTVTQGQSGNTTITITPMGGALSSQVTFVCVGLPNLSNCTFNPTTLNPGANPATTTLTISTTAGSTLFVPPPMDDTPLPFVVPSLVLLVLLLAATILVRESRRRRLLAGLTLWAAVAVAALQLACGGGGGGGGSPPPPPGTPRGTFTVTVNATSGTTQRAVTITLTVN